MERLTHVTMGNVSYVQGSAKRRGIGCVNSLPGSAWLQLSKQLCLFADLCSGRRVLSVRQRGEVHDSWKSHEQASSVGTEGQSGTKPRSISSCNSLHVATWTDKFQRRPGMLHLPRLECQKTTNEEVAWHKRILHLKLASSLRFDIYLKTKIQAN